MIGGNVHHCRCHNLAVTGAQAVDFRPSACHGRFKGNSQAPVIQIHKAALYIERPADIEVNVRSKRTVDIICRSCGCTLLLYASRKGAFCQITEPAPMPVYGSLPNRVLTIAASTSPMPLSVRPLFRQRETDLFQFADQGARSDGRDRTDDPTDEDLMFGNGLEPFVGSYSALGRFATEDDYFVVVE
jgi:hypothetical protein